MFKRIRILLPILIVPFLTSCRGTTVTKTSTIELGSITNMSKSSIDYSCQRCDGTATYSLTISKNQSLDMKADFIVELGALTITVMDKKNNLENFIVVEDYSRTINFENYGSYKIRVVADEFKGSYSFNWAK